MPETKPTTIRLSEQGRANAEAIIKSGAATSISTAIHVALALVAKNFAENERAYRIRRRIRG